MKVAEFIDKVWWSTKIAIIEPSKKGDENGIEIRKRALFYGIADEYEKEWEKNLNNKKIEGFGALNNRIIVIVEEENKWMKN